MISGKFSKQIECLKRLSELTTSMDEILDFLFTEKVATKDECSAVKRSTNQHKELVILLQTLKANDKFQLLEYEWTILPVERICITIVTDKTRKEFDYSSY